MSPDGTGAPRKRDCGLGAVFLNHGTFYICYAANGLRIKESSHGKDRAVAEALLEQRLREATPVPPGLRSRTVLVGDLIDLAKKEFQAQHPRSYRTFAYKANPLLERFGTVAAEDLPTEDVAAWQRERLSAGYSGFYVADCMRILKRGYAIGRRAGILKRWPIIAINWDRTLKSTRERRQRKPPPARSRRPRRIGPRLISMPEAPAEVLTVTHLHDLHIRDCILNERRIGSYYQHWRPVLENMGNVDPRTITYRHIEEYKYRRLSEGAARATINAELVHLKRGFNIARIHGFLEKMPVIQVFRGTPIRQGFLQPEEFRRLFATLEVLDADVAAAVKVLYLLGWRRREVLDLQWSEVSLKHGLLTLPAKRSKTRTIRRVKLAEEVLAIFRKQWETRKPGEHGDFVFHRDSLPIYDFRGVWKRAAAALGRPELLVHDLRRSMARNALQAGVPQPIIMSLGGWLTPSTFQRYAIVDEGMLADAMEKVCAFAAGPKKPPEKLIFRCEEVEA